jgi:hypothetical protein
MGAYDFCFHASCAMVVAEANRRLRRELGASPWELRLPDGRALRSGDILQKDGSVVLRESIQSPIARQKSSWCSRRCA